MIGLAKYRWEREPLEEQKLNGYGSSEASLMSKLLSQTPENKLATISNERKKDRAESSLFS